MINTKFINLRKLTVFTLITLGIILFSNCNSTANKDKMVSTQKEKTL